MPRPVVRRGLLALLMLTLLAGCTAGPSARPAVVERGGPGNVDADAQARDQPSLPGLRDPESPQIPWSDCASTVRERLDVDTGELRFECAQLIGSSGPSAPPLSALTRVALLRAGGGPIPLVVLNDADGEPGTLYAARLATRLPKAILARFSLIGMDRRGTGESDPVHCVPQDVRDSILGYDPAESDLTGLLDATRDATQQCTIALDNRLQTFNSANTVDDLALLREGLGVPRLHAIGRGEGSRVLAAFADRHPRQVGRFVLDGLPDPAADLQGRTAGQAMGAEAAFDAFAQRCVAAGCPLGDTPRQAVTELLDSLRERPISASDGVLLNPGIAVNALLVGLAEQDRWPRLWAAVQSARSGTAGPLLSFLRPELLDSLAENARFDSGMATTCNDEDTRLPPERVDAAYKDLAGRYPLFGGRFAQRLLLCTPWPIPAQPLRAPSTAAAPPVLVLATTSDPVTPSEGTKRAAQQIAGSVLLSWQGAGHGAVPVSDCATSRVQAFLLDGTVPAGNVTCPG